MKIHRLILSALFFVLTFQFVSHYLCLTFFGYPSTSPRTKLQRKMEMQNRRPPRRRSSREEHVDGSDKKMRKLQAVDEKKSTQKLHDSSGTFDTMKPRRRYPNVSQSSSPAMTIDQKLTFDKFVRPAHAEDVEGPFLAEVQQLLRTVRLHAMLDVGSSLSGHMSQLFGHEFDRVVVLATDSIVLNSIKSKLPHPRAEFVLRDIISFGSNSHEKFDVVFLNMVLHKLPTHEVAPTIRALEALLADEGIGIISTTRAEEGHGGFYFSTGDMASEDEFNQLKNVAPGIARARRWTKSELMWQLRGKLWEVTGHVLFTSFSNQSYPSSQMIAVRHLVSPYSSKFAAPLEPSSTSVKDVIFALVRGGSFLSDYDDLVDSRKCLTAALKMNGSNDKTDFDEVYFHEGNVREHVQRRLNEVLPGSRFVDIRSYGGFGGKGSGSGGGIFRWTPWVRLRRPGEYSIGYRHMCRFMTMLWMQVLSKYEYAARIDDDVCIHKMVHPFRFLRESHADYAYALLTTEKHKETVQTMAPWLKEFVKNRSIAPRRPFNAQRMYFTNFFVTNVSWWLNDSVRLFMHTVDRTGNIYYHRWGDAPLQTAALDIFAEPDRVQWLRVDYSHMSTFNEVRNGTEVGGVDALSIYSKIRTTPKLESGPMTSEDIYNRNWNLHAAPCLVADYFKLPRAPFKSQISAVRALTKVLYAPAMAEGIDVHKYSPEGLAYAVQFDVYNSSEPLPADDVQGAARRNAMARLISGRDREHPEYKDFTFDEWRTLVGSQCFCSVANLKASLSGMVLT